MADWMSRFSANYKKQADQNKKTFNMIQNGRNQ
jgi:hypothetical protein